jgi:hypothetical protein
MVERAQIMESFMKSHRRGLTMLLLAVVAGCANEVGPENERVVVNAPDRFSYSINNLDEISDAERFEWENTGTRAEIEILQGISQGAALLSVQDAAGTVLYRDDIADGNDTVTEDGVAGTWIIEVSFDGTSGAFSFTVSKDD